jgi:hypothetical protein
MYLQEKSTYESVSNKKNDIWTSCLVWKKLLYTETNQGAMDPFAAGARVTGSNLSSILPCRQVHAPTTYLGIYKAALLHAALQPASSSFFLSPDDYLVKATADEPGT